MAAIEQVSTGHGSARAVISNWWSGAWSHAQPGRGVGERRSATLMRDQACPCSGDPMIMVSSRRRRRICFKRSCTYLRRLV